MVPNSNGLPKYVVNFEELTEPLKNELLDIIVGELKYKYPQVNTHCIESIMENIISKLPANQYEDLKKKIYDFVYKKIEGIQKVEGALLDIPPIVKSTKYDFIYEKDVFLTGLHVDQNGWKKEDRYHLEINKKKIIKNAATKEVGEHKHFNTYYKVNANTPISFILENNSGNSRETMIDLEYIEGVETTIIPQPPPVSDDEYWMDMIKNPWDLTVVVNWETGSADVDLHGFIGNNHVSFATKVSNGMYLNWDYTQHNDNTNPEILSVDGNHGKSLEIRLRNYNGVALNDPVSVKIYNKTATGKPKLLKEYNVKLHNDTRYLYGVCTIEIDTFTISDLKSNITVL